MKLFKAIQKDELTVGQFAFIAAVVFVTAIIATYLIDPSLLK
jgi:hypothetical protein